MHLEKEVATELRRTKVREVILGSLQFSGIVALAVLAPNTLSVLGKLITRSSQNSVKSSILRLKEAGYIEFQKKNGGVFVKLTAKGSLYLAKNLGAVQRPRKWDGKWRLIIFDISETRKFARSKLRDALRTIGFIKLQNSVWVFPYDCEEIVILMKSDYRLGKEVLYIIADKLENDTRIRRHFGL